MPGRLGPSKIPYYGEGPGFSKLNKRIFSWQSPD